MRGSPFVPAAVPAYVEHILLYAKRPRGILRLPSAVALRSLTWRRPRTLPSAVSTKCVAWSTFTAHRSPGPGLAVPVSRSSRVDRSVSRQQQSAKRLVAYKLNLTVGLRPPVAETGTRRHLDPPTQVQVPAGAAYSQDSTPRQLCLWQLDTRVSTLAPQNSRRRGSSARITYRSVRRAGRAGGRGERPRRRGTLLILTYLDPRRRSP